MNNKSFCVYPWINLHTNTDGRCKLCCHVYGEDYVKIDGKDAILGKDKFDDIWHGEYMSNVRQKMLQGLPVKECNRCYEHEEKGLESSRQWANKAYPLENLEIFDPTHLELRLGNHCNLKCNSCWSVSSDQLYKERKKILNTIQVPTWLSNQWNHEIKSVEKFDWKWFETEEFRKFVNRVAPHLKRLYLTGGEPTLIEANKYVLDKLIESGNRNCHVAWTTNLTSYPEAFYSKLDFFNTSEVQMSIDGYGDHNRYIRYPTDWNVLEQNFKKLQNLPEKVELKIYFVYQAWNVFDVVPLINWIESNRTRRIDFVPIFLESPEQIHSCVWPADIRSQVIEELKTISINVYRNPINQIINYTLNTDKYSVENLNKMKTFIGINDTFRKYKFNDTFPELTKILDNECKI